jgi:hypothetical protein
VSLQCEWINQVSSSSVIHLRLQTASLRPLTPPWEETIILSGRLAKLILSLRLFRWCPTFTTSFSQAGDSNKHLRNTHPMTQHKLQYNWRRVNGDLRAISCSKWHSMPGYTTFSPDDGNRSSLWNILFSSEYQLMGKVQKSTNSKI